MYAIPMPFIIVNMSKILGKGRGDLVLGNTKHGFKLCSKLNKGVIAKRESGFLVFGA